MIIYYKRLVIPFERVFILRNPAVKENTFQANDIKFHTHRFKPERCDLSIS